MIPIEQQFRIRWSATDFGIRVTPGFIQSDAFGGSGGEFTEKSATLPANATRWIYGDATDDGALFVSATHLGPDQGALYFIGKVVTGQVGVVSVDQPASVVPPDGIDLLSGEALTLGNTTVSGNVTISGNLTVNGTQTAGATIPTVEQRRFGLPQVSGVLFDGVTAGTRITAPCQDVVTGDFSIWVRVRVPTSAPSLSFIYAGVSGSSTTVFSAPGAFYIAQETSGSLTVSGFLSGAGQIFITASGFVAAYGGQIVDIVYTRQTVGGTTTGTLYLNGVSVGSSTAAVVATDAKSSFFHLGSTAGGQANHTMHRAAFYNRALSVSDVTELITCGVNQADMWGTTTPSYASNFSAGADSWGASNGTAAGNIDSIGGQNDNLRYTIAAGTNNADGVTRGGILTVGKRFRFEFSYFIPAGQIQTTMLRAFVGLTSVISNLSATNTWTPVSAEGVATGDATLRINQNFSGTGNGTDVFYVRGVAVTRIGAVVNLDLTPGVGLFFPDMSTNLLHADGFGGISHTMPREYGQMTVVKDLLHSDISSTLGTTLLLQLPPNCGIVHVEFDRVTAFDAGVTLEVGTAASGTKFAAATAASATGIIGAASASLTSESNSSNVPIYVRKSGATTVGRVRVRVTYSIRG